MQGGCGADGCGWVEGGGVELVDCLGAGEVGAFSVGGLGAGEIWWGVLVGVVMFEVWVG